MVIVTVEIEYVPPKAIFTSYIGCSVELWLFVKQHLLVVDATDRQVLPRNTDSSGGNKHVSGFSHTCVEKTTQVKNKNSKNNTKTNKFCVWSPPRLKDFL